MKTKLETEKDWIKITEQIAGKYAKDKTEFFKIKDECAREFMWYFSHPITEKELVNRIEKYSRFKEADKAHLFDPYWKPRLEFLNWVLEK
jgi:hypothetical protein